MVLFCPACGDQHIDEPEEPLSQHGGFLPPEPGDDYWDNPPHRSHLCHGCGHIWRPADVPTTGVQAVQTKGKADSPLAALPCKGGWPKASKAKVPVEDFLAAPSTEPDTGRGLREALEKIDKVATEAASAADAGYHVKVSTLVTIYELARQALAALSDTHETPEKQA